jgi:hypothetical protein
MITILRGGLQVTARQLFELSRLVDRAGDAYLNVSYDGTAALLLDTVGIGQPTLALELNREGRVTGYKPLPYLVEPEDDGLDDLSEEQPRPPPPDAAVLALGDGARRASPCKCSAPRPAFDEPETCAMCGHRLNGSRVPAASRRTRA